MRPDAPIVASVDLWDSSGTRESDSVTGEVRERSARVSHIAKARIVSTCRTATPADEKQGDRTQASYRTAYENDPLKEIFSSSEIGEGAIVALGRTVLAEHANDLTRRIGPGERPNHQAVDDAEDTGVDADAERQDAYGGHREAGMLA